MLFTPSQLLVLGLAALSNAHMIMNTPVPFGKSSLNNSPLAADGSDFPCKQRTGVYEAEGASNSMALGSTQPLKFTGGATHGGGSCQISITYDKQPSKSSVWKVIHSIEGGCPVQGVEGNVGDDANSASPTSYTFPVPDSLPVGDAVLAWTWFNKVGNREMYMNCAPVTLGASKKRDLEYLEAQNVTQLMERDTAAFDALPDMFVANIGSGCGTDNGDLKFPNAGDSVTTMGSGKGASDYKAPTGNCAAGGAAATGSGAAPAKTTSAASGGDAPKTSAAAGGAPSSASKLPGGVFATVAPSKTGESSQTAAPSVPASSAPVASSAPSATAAPASPASSAAPPKASGSTGSGSAQTGACSTEGEWNCVGGSSFQQCASGQWSAVQQMSAGMTCNPGESDSLSMKAVGAKIKRAIRFSPEHARRNVRGSS